MVMEFESKPTFKSVILAGLFAAVLAQPPITPPQPTTEPPPLTTPPPPLTTPPFQTTPTPPPTTTGATTIQVGYIEPDRCYICAPEITLCIPQSACSALNSCENVGVEDFVHCNPMGNSAPCSLFRYSEENGLIPLANQVKDLLKKQKKQLKKFWPCFKGVLSGIKMFAINVDLCHSIYGSDGAAIVQEMRNLLKAREWTVTRILTHIGGKMRQLTTGFMGYKPFKSSSTYSNHFADLLDGIAKTVSEMTNDDLKKSLGPKCFKKLSKRCI